MTATFLAFDYRRLYHLVLTKPPNENQTFRPIPFVTSPAHPPSVDSLLSSAIHIGPSRDRKRTFHPQVRRAHAPS